MSEERLIFFNTRKEAREYAFKNGLNTKSVIDLGAKQPIGSRWALNMQNIMNSAKELDNTIIKERKEKFTFKVGLNIFSEKLNKLFGK